LRTICGTRWQLQLPLGPGPPNFHWPLARTTDTCGSVLSARGSGTHEWNAKPVGPFGLLLIFHLLCTYLTQPECVFCSLFLSSTASLLPIPTVTLQGFLCWPSWLWPAYVWQLPSVYCLFFVPAGWLSCRRLAALSAIKPTESQPYSHKPIYHLPSSRLPPVMTLNELYACCSGPGLSFLCFCRHCQCKNLSSCAVFCCCFVFSSTSSSSLVNCRRKCSGSAELVNCRLA